MNLLVIFISGLFSYRPLHPNTRTMVWGLYFVQSTTYTCVIQVDYKFVK